MEFGKTVYRLIKFVLSLSRVVILYVCNCIYDVHRLPCVLKYLSVYSGKLYFEVFTG